MAIEKLRCVHKDSGEVMFAPVHMANDPEWRRISGYELEELEEADNPDAAASDTKNVFGVDLEWKIRSHETDLSHVMAPEECRFIGSESECALFIEKNRPEDNHDELTEQEKLIEKESVKKDPEDETESPAPVKQEELPIEINDEDHREEDEQADPADNHNSEATPKKGSGKQERLRVNRD